VAIFRSRFTRADLLVLVGRILLVANPAAPGSVTTRAFDAARATAGFPDCPTARTLCYERLDMTWPELKAIALDPKRSISATAGRRYSYDKTDMQLTLPRAVFALRLVAMQLKRRTLAETEYVTAHHALMRRDRRAYRHGGMLQLPTNDQIVRIAGSWEAALAAAGLDPPGRSDRPCLSVEEVLDLHLARYGFRPSAKNLQRFVNAEGLRVNGYFNRGFPARVIAWRNSCEQRGLPITPSPKGVSHFDYGPPAPWEQSARSKRGWTEIELVQLLADAWERLRPDEDMTVTSYLALQREDKKLPSVKTFFTGGRPGFAACRDQARERRFAAFKDS
jgi:hypothetical protein